MAQARATAMSASSSFHARWRAYHIPSMSCVSQLRTLLKACDMVSTLPNKRELLVDELLDRKEFAEVNLWRLAQAIEAGKLDPTAVIDADALIKAGVLRRAKDGVRLLGKGELKTKVELSIHSASASARAAIEAAGGKLTTVLAAIDPNAEVPAPTKGKKAEAAAKPAVATPQPVRSRP